MASKSSLLLLLLAISLGWGALPLAAQVAAPVTRKPAVQQLDEARLAAMRKAIREHARHLHPEDLAKAPSQAKPLHPLKPGPADTASVVSDKKLTVEKKPDQSSDRGPLWPLALRMATMGSPPQNKTPSTSANQANANPAATKPSSQVSANPSSKSFNPYPQGPDVRAPALPPGYYPNVFVSGPGRLDWTYVLSDSSLDPVPSAVTAGYLSTRQTYELYVPPGYDPRRPYPMIIHVTAGPRSDAGAQWQHTCRAHNVILAGAHNAGNSVHDVARVRIVLDVLDDVRRRFRIDPDRTYISGMSGGGKIAAQISFALPELFGGLAAICGCWNLRAEPMMRQRVSERLSLALLTGAMDFNRPELEREWFPILREHGARSIVQVYPGMGHAYPNAAQLDQVFRWLEGGLLIRRFNSSFFPASRLIGPLSPNDWSTAVLLEASRRLELPGGMEAGLFFLQGVINRWPGLPAANVAQTLLDEFDKTSPVPWKDIYRMELLRFRYLQAHMFDGIVNGPLPANYLVPRINLVRIAVWLWTDIQNLSTPDSPVAQEAKARLTQLHSQGG
jgi:predicted esterase